MRHLASFRTFLSSGALGPLDAGCTLLETAELLGPPQGWITGQDEPIPLYWQYEDPDGGPLLEIRFGVESPHWLEWYQLEHANLLSRDVHLFGAHLALATDGFHGASKASELLGSGVWDKESTRICFDPEDLTLTITAGKIVVIMAAVETTSIERGRRGELLDAFGTDPLFLEFERSCEIDSIYAHAQEQDRSTASTDAKCCSGEQYLASLRAVGGVP